MKTLVFVVFLLLVGMVAVGFYRGWFQLSTDASDQRPNATITVDKDKFRHDEQEAKDKIQGFENAAKEKVGNRADKVQESERRP